jgi:sulfur carrier protein ThiS
VSAAAPLIELRLPSVLEGTDRVKVRARTLPEVLEAAFAQLPQLRRHLTLDDGGLRPHVLLLLNGESVLREEVATTRVSAGDEVRVHQAISGG